MVAKRGKKGAGAGSRRAAVATDVTAVAGALDRRAEKLLSLPGVLGVAVGFRRRKGQIKNEPVITVFVRYGLKRRALSGVPRHHRIPRRMRVRVKDKTWLVPLDLVPSRPGRLHAGSTPVPPGEIVGNQRTPRNVGTLGWIAKLGGGDGRPVVCGACHVFLRLPGSNFVGDGDKSFVFSADDLELLAIPPSNGGDAVSAFVLAGRRGGPLDAAVAILEDGMPSRDIPGLGPMGRRRHIVPEDVTVSGGPSVSMRTGRGRLLDGKITRYPAHMTFLYRDAPGGMVIEDLIETDLPTVGGDSGGLLVDEDIRPLGMLVGAASGRSYFVHVRNVVEQFGVTDL